jgi:asparagine synthase (glutamine-hydrolysing)
MNGIFGFAIYDVDKDEYFIARDHMGLILLHWLGQHGTLCSFRIKSILKDIVQKFNYFQDII